MSALLDSTAAAALRLVAGVQSGARLPSSRALRWINEIPLLAFIPIVWLVLAKPF